MKKTSIIVNVILFIAVGVLYILFFSQKQSNTSTNSLANLNDTSSVSALPVAFVNIDSVLLGYDLAKELNDELQSKQGKMKAKLEKDASEFEKEAQVFQDKVQRGIYLTQQRAAEAQQKLVMKQKELQQLELEYSNQLAYEQQVMNARLFDSISNYIYKLNTPEKYQLIVAKSVTANVLYGSAKIDITQEVLKGLNENYSKNK